MSTKAARRMVRKQMKNDERLVTRGQAARMLTILDKNWQEQRTHLVEDFQVALGELREHIDSVGLRVAADRERPWWRRFLGLPAKEDG